MDIYSLGCPTAHLRMTSTLQILLCVAITLNLPLARAVNCNLRSGSSCVCDLDDKSGFIDLNPISKSDGTAFFPTINDGYSFNPCFPYKDSKCTNDIAVCQSHAVSCGRQDTVTFKITKTNPIAGTLEYGNGDDLGKTPRISIISLVCDEKTDSDMKFNTEHPKGTYTFTLTSKYVCAQKPATTKPKPPPVTTHPQPQPTTHSGHHTPKDNPISLGTILDICVLLVLVTYLTAGTALMYVRYERRGREALPNYTFWILLPGLIKEGCMFLVDKVKSIRSGRKAGYEGI